MSEIIEMGTVSSRGQISIPADIREEMGLGEGSRVLFLLQDNSLLVKKVTKQTFTEITKPLHEEAKRIGLTEADVPKLIQRFRKAKK